MQSQLETLLELSIMLVRYERECEQRVRPVAGDRDDECPSVEELSGE